MFKKSCLRIRQLVLVDVVASEGWLGRRFQHGFCVHEARHG